MRLFVAVEIGAAVAAAAGSLVAELRRRAGRLAPRARISWVSPERMHVTVRFIGEADEATANAIIDVLRAPLRTTPFSLAFQGAGVFPSRGPARVLWAGIVAGGGPLALIEQEVSARLATAGVRAEGRPFQPHLTLARVREAAGLRTAPLLEGLAAVPIGDTAVDACILFRSRTGSPGVAYEPLLRVPLAPP